MDSVFQEKYDATASKRWTLPPVLIFLAVCALTIGALLGTIASIALYRFPSATAGVGTCQSLILIASSITAIFLGMYLLAARRNEPVGELRPPIRPLHSACFVVMRVMMVFWAIAVTASIITTLKMESSVVDVELFTLQRIAAASSGAALLSIIMILIGLERCEKPFETPSFLRIRPRVTCRVSSFNGLLDRSISHRYIDREKLHFQRTFSDASSESLAKSQMKGGYGPQTPEPVAVRSRSAAMTIWPPGGTMVGQNGQNWRVAWNDLAQDTGVNKMQSVPSSMPSTSCNSPRYAASSVYSSDPSSEEESQSAGYTNGTITSRETSSSRGTSLTRGTNPSRGLHPKPPRKSGRASPSSSISSSSQRSPLSTMRTVEHPDIPIRPDLRIFSLPSHPQPRVSSKRRRYRPELRSSRSMPHTHAQQQQVLSSLPPFRMSTRPSSAPRSVISDTSSTRSRPTTPRSPHLPGPRAADSRSAGQSGGSRERYRPVRDHAVTIEAHTQKILESVRLSMEQRQMTARMEENARRQEAYDRGRPLMRPRQMSPPYGQGRFEVPPMPTIPPNLRVRNA